MGKLFSGSGFDAKKTADDQRAENDRQLQTQIDTRAKVGGTQDAYGGTRQFRQNADGTYTTVDTLGEAGQQRLNGLNALGKRVTGAQGDLLDRTMDPTAIGASADKYYASATANTSRMQDQQRQALDSTLRNQGLVPGTAAYDRAMRGFENSAADANMRQYDISQRTAHDAALSDLSNQQGYALGLGGQLAAPLNRQLGVDASGSFNPNVAGPVNVAGLEMQQAQMDEARNNALWGAIGGIGGSLLGLPGVGGALGGGLTRMGSSIGLGGGAGGDLPWNPVRNPRFT